MPCRQSNFNLRSFISPPNTKEVIMIGLLIVIILVIVIVRLL